MMGQPAAGAERKLAAIMFTDMVGYSALAQRNEALAITLLGEQQNRLRPLFVQYGGREIKSIGDGHQFYGYSLAAVRRGSEGVAEAQRAVKIDPLSSEANGFLGAILYFARRYDEAIGVLRETTELDPSYWFTQEWLGQSYLRKGDVGRGIAAIRRARDIDPHNAEVLGGLGYAYAVAGQRDAAREIIEELRQLAQRTYVAAYDFAVIYAGLGDTDQAFDWLEKAYDDRSYYLVWLKAAPQLDPMRSDPRFTALVKKVGLAP